MINQQKETYQEGWTCLEVQLSTHLELAYGSILIKSFQHSLIASFQPFSSIYTLQAILNYHPFLKLPCPFLMLFPHSTAWHCSSQVLCKFLCPTSTFATAITALHFIIMCMSEIKMLPSITFHPWIPNDELITTQLTCTAVSVQATTSAPVLTIGPQSSASTINLFQLQLWIL